MAAFFAMRRSQTIFNGIILFASAFAARPLLAQTAPDFTRSPVAFRGGAENRRRGNTAQ